VGQVLDPKLITPALLSVVVVWALYRRFRRNIGRQAVDVRRLRIRVGIFVLLGALVPLVAARDMSLLGALLGGIAGGTAMRGISIHRILILDFS
jgi:hypothetical protein